LRETNARFVVRAKVLWDSYGAALSNASHSYGRTPSYGPKERFMFELFVLLVGIAACGLVILYDHQRNRL
jgi:hypothetical protein